MKFFLQVVDKIPVNIVLLLSAFFVILGDLLGKYWSINRKESFIIAALAASFLSGVFYYPVLLKEGLVVTSIIWSLLSIIGFLAIGLLVFKESLTTPQIVGVALGGVALIILTVSTK